jgi:hypothetical protein
MRRFHMLLGFALVCLTILSACSGSGKSAGQEFENFDADNFDDTVGVNHPYFPLKPGTQYIYEGFTNDDNGNRVARRLIVTVTDLTKVIDGVRSMISWDRDYNADALVEAELAFYAQDDDGTVWRMGEHPEEYQDGKLVDAPTWIHGIEESVAGIEMLANPSPDAPTYSQGWAPAVDFTDRGQVYQTRQSVCVPAACYENVLVIDETSKAEPDAHQLKYYAPDVGNIKVDWKGKDQTQETLELTEIKQLSPDELAKAHAEALQLEKSAYENSKEVYGQTSPAE